MRIHTNVVGLSRALAVMLVLALPALSAASIVFSDEGAFLAAAPPLSMESFEGLPVDNETYMWDTIVVDDFTITAPGVVLSVWDIPVSGGHATDGDNFIRHSAFEGMYSMTLTFNDAINAFGINITDWGDWSDTGTLSYADNAGNFFDVAYAPLPDENEVFFGIISDIAITSVTFDHDIAGEGWSIDEVYYGIPEPGTLVLLGLGGLLAIRRRR